MSRIVVMEVAGAQEEDWLRMAIQAWNERSARHAVKPTNWTSFPTTAVGP